MEIGTAQIDITPAIGGELSGFAARAQPSIGVLDPLAARALCLEDGAEKLLWLHCDLIGFDAGIVADFRGWAASHLGLRPAQVLLTATHTHSGPATIHLEAAGAYDRDFAAFLQGCLRCAASEAIARREPGVVVTGHRPFDLAVDRRGQASAHVDPALGAVGFKRADGTYIAALANYAIHPVALGPGNRRLSADLFGAAANELSARLPGRPVALVTNGACGNLNPPALDVAPAQSEAWGRAIGRASAESLRRAAGPVAAELRTAVATVDLPLDVLDRVGIDAHAARALAHEAARSDSAERMQRVLARWREPLLAALAARRVAATRPVELFALRLAGQTWIGVNAEVFSVFTAWLRDALGPGAFTLGYANGDFGYICPEAAYAEGGYEVEAAHLFHGGYRLAPGGLERLAAAAIALARDVAGARREASLAPAAR